MSEWAKVSLSEVATITPGFAFKSKEFSQHGTPVVKIKDINPPLVNSSDLARIDEDAYPFGKLDKYRLQSGDFVVAMTGATIGKVGRYVSKERGLLNQRVAKISPIHSVSWDFIYHAVSMPYFDRFIENNIDSESAQANISASGIGRYSIALPKLKEQEAIAEVLSSLDDKIDLLKRQNKTLEGMAEALFRQWFIEEAQDDWEYKELGRFVDVINGLSYKSSDLNQSSTAMISLKCFPREGGFSREGLKEFNGRFKESHVARKGDLFVACTDLTQDAEVVGNPIVVNDTFGYSKLVFSMDTVKIQPTGDFGAQFLYQLMRTRMFKEHCKAFANGSTVLHLQKSAIPEFEFSVPPSWKVLEFESKCERFHEKVVLNERQIEILQQERDTLLPKLMSGEVRVNLD